MEPVKKTSYKQYYQFLETMHCSHIKLLKYCRKTQEIKRQCNNKLPII